MISISDAFRNGLEQRGERVYLSVSIAIATLYAVALVAFSTFDVRVDQTFYERRDEVRLRLANISALEVGRPSAVTASTVALLRGWSSPERWGVWSDGPVASFGVRLPAHRMIEPRVVVTVAVALDRGGEQEVSAEVNGHKAGRWDLHRASAELQIAIPPGALPPSGGAVVTLHVSDPMPPPNSRDTRALGIGLKSVSMSDDGQPSGQATPEGSGSAGAATLRN